MRAEELKDQENSSQKLQTSSIKNDREMVRKGGLYLKTNKMHA
jgi:hypothetical protein